MAEYYSKEDREIIERLNEVLRMEHRSKPFDFTDVEDLKEVFTLTVAEYLDYLNYQFTLIDVIENFDESLECFDPVTWTSLHDSEVEGDELLQDVYGYINKAVTYMGEASGRAEENCRELLKIILNMNSGLKEAVLGKKYIYDAEAIESVFEESWEIKDTYSIQESRDAFIEIIDEKLSVEK